MRSVAFLSAQSTSHYIDLVKISFHDFDLNDLTPDFVLLSFTGVHLIQTSVTYGPTGSPAPAFLRDTRATAS